MEECGLESAMTGCCEYGNELLGSIRCGEFYELLTNWWLIEKDVVP